jgi:hypothetical protein
MPIASLRQLCSRCLRGVWESLAFLIAHEPPAKSAKPLQSEMEGLTTAGMVVMLFGPNPRLAVRGN